MAAADQRDNDPNTLRLASRRPAVATPAQTAEALRASAPRSWTFVTNHAQVLLYLARNPGARVREIALAAQITERAAYRILSDLQETGYVGRSKQGRRNRYRIDTELPLEDPVVEQARVADLLALLTSAEAEAHALVTPRSLRRRD